MAKKRQPNQHEKTEVLDRPKLKRPPMYRVILHNDDYTTQEFVISILQMFFHKNMEQAQKLMLAVHRTGKGVAGIYPYDIAITKVKQVEMHANRCEMPLMVSVEPDQ